MSKSVEVFVHVFQRVDHHRELQCHDKDFDCHVTITNPNTLPKKARLKVVLCYGEPLCRRICRQVNQSAVSAASIASAQTVPAILDPLELDLLADRGVSHAESVSSDTIAGPSGACSASGESQPDEKTLND